MSARARTAAHTLVTSVARFAIGGVMTVLTARMLGPEGRGAYAVLLTLAATAVSLGHLSVDASHTSLWSQAVNRRAIAANSLLFGLVLGVASAVSCALLVTSVGARSMPVPGHALLGLALLTIPCSMIVYYLSGVLVLRERAELVNWIGLAGVGVPCAVLLTLNVVGEPTLTVVVAVWVLSAVVPMVLVIAAVRPRLRDRDLTLARRAFGMGLLYHVGGASLFLLLRVDVLVLNAYSTAAAVGLYAVAVALMDLSRSAGDAIAQAVLPGQMAEARECASELTARVTRLSALLSAGLAALICLAAPPLITFAYGPEYGGSVLPMLCLAPGLVALSVARVVGAFLLRLERPVLRSAIAAGALAVNVLLTVILIPRHGIAGCAVASSVAYCLLAAAYLLWFCRAAKTPLRALLPGPAEIRYLRSAGTRMALSR